MDTTEPRRFKVAYQVAATRTAPAGRGTLTVLATTAEDALTKAQTIHRAGKYPTTPTTNWGGPGSGSVSGAMSSYKTLPKKDQSRFSYDTPVLVNA